ncbi:MAG: CBS domain-containing protein [Crenarchaeota archaeon]|nr:MAG: CBS domain-containing protein [Thermoproteota archaeon]RDJ34578.1 MAG: CBS domain-containing protein [Thermoproteota archaeon]RDJ35902.1 MAG: CBS domain-containing protein [Thermoproteota archaeon]RDJ38479.1 MAG: CBS domain-containing protein [Thermoproteota archaeon]
MSFQMLNDPVSRFTHLHMISVSHDVSVTDAAKELDKQKTDSILVHENNDLIGIVTLKDILTKVVAKGKNPNEIKVGDIANKPLLKIHKDSKVKDALKLMKQHDIRRLIVTNDERPIGIISRKVVIGNMGEYSVDMPELEIPEKVTCPYCSSEFSEKKALSKHIDDIHIGKGLLEGNLSKA